MPTPARIKAELARRELLANQLKPYDDPERGHVAPRRDPKTAQEAFLFIDWLEREIERNP